MVYDVTMLKAFYASYKGKMEQKKPESNFSVSVLGIVSPFSQRDTACLVT